MSSDVVLKLDYFEFGYLFGALLQHPHDNMPESLQLKLKICFAKAYLKHPTLKKQAKKEIAEYEKRLKELERSGGNTTTHHDQGEKK